ncbi:hypothetical protein [Aurantiacibacter gangjinensis]|uniref:Uncharacterized protein n=1 Tax=Aurantiacibacter gangjinensis TaxID=502682 RepID=A0A0G9MP74_9SPHN|nr:hypothetical protein [Aurantiacibacter gangjinensis]APE29295.1 hypothetical protein BMF35_b0040 [Aurantiacibacter gangjinensis]KLE31108.1 hypothetical protein AAW01_12820 [Aurantiacibacter gangjinensis]
MNMTSFLPRRWRSKKEAARHADAIAGILQTPPIVPKQDGLVLFSMIGTAVLLPYLVAVKSLWHELRRGRVAILDDGTLTAQDRAVLAHHCGDPQIMRIDDVQTGDFPQGGCWERLLTILDHRASEYWIQLDSDTVTLGPVPEIAEAIARNRSFLFLGGEEGEVGPLPLAEFRERFYPDGAEEGHVQARIESRLDTIPAKREWKYTRGCAGFAGFAAMGPGRSLSAAFLDEMARMIGPDDVSIWGTEQVASNFHLSNEAEPVVLPYDRYLNYWNAPWGSDACFVHFVGTHRHDNGAYIDASVDAIARLKG